MKFRFLGALIAAPVIASSGIALSEDFPPIDTVSARPTVCIVHLGSDTFIQGTDGRVFVKFDVKREPLTVTANCTVTAFSGDAPMEPFSEDGFDCFVQLSGFHQILYGSDPEVRNKKRFRNGKATLSCSGPYDPLQSPNYEPVP